MKKFLLSVGVLAVCGVGAVSAQTQITQAPFTETGTYDAVTLLDGETKAKLTNNWLYTVTESAGNYFGFVAGNARNMAYANGKVYIAERNTKEEEDKSISGKIFLHVFDAATGAFKETKEIKAPVFRKADDETRFINNFPATTLTTDSKGRLVLANLATNIQGGLLEVWVLDDENDANPTKVLGVADYIGLPAAPAPRVDYINVFGDLKSGKAYIFGALAGNTYVVRWEIVDGGYTMVGDDVTIMDPNEVTNPMVVTIPSSAVDQAKNNFYPKTAVNFGTAPFVLPVRADLFYVDGHAVIPSLYDMKGNISDGFFDGASTEAVKPALAGVPNTGANGIAEISLGDHSFIVAGKNNHGPAEMSDRNTFIIYEKKGGDISEGISTVIPSFPLIGNGKTAVTNGSYVVLPRVNIVDSKTAEIYIFAQDNGFGKYTLIVDKGQSLIEDSAENVTVSVNGYVITASEEVASIEVYTIAGQKVATATATATVDAPATGVYVVKTVDNGGAVVSHKVLVK